MGVRCVAVVGRQPPKYVMSATKGAMLAAANNVNMAALRNSVADVCRTRCSIVVLRAQIKLSEKMAQIRGNVQVIHMLCMQKTLTDGRGLSLNGALPGYCMTRL